MLTKPAALLRLEGAVLLIATFAIYRELNAGWLLFLALILAPDVFMLGYLVNPKLGAALYNFVHTEALPLLAGAVFWELHRTTALAVCMIWLFHIGMDRALGFGLKYPTAFKDTHLQRT